MSFLPLAARSSLYRFARERVPLRGNLRLLIAWPAFCVFLIGLLWSLTGSKLDGEQAAVRKSALQEASLLSRAYADHLHRSMEQIDLITRHAKHDWEESRGRFRLENVAGKELYPSSEQVFVTIVDRDGWAISSTHPIVKTFNVATRDFFLKHKASPDNALQIGTPQQGSRKPVTLIRFSRRLSAPDGSFAGVVIVNVMPSFLLSFDADSSLGKAGLVAVMGVQDGMVRAARIGQDTDRTMDLVFVGPREFEAGGGARLFAADRFFDGHARFMAWQPLSTYPLIAVIGLSQEEAFAAHQSTSKDYRYLATMGTAFLAFAALLGMLFSFRLASKRAQAEEVRRIFQLAIEGAQEGFYMVRALFDRDGGIADFQFEDCNERGAQFLGHTRAGLISLKLSDLYAKRYARKVMKVFLHAMQTGFHESEFRASPRSRLKAAWVHQRTVRSGNGLAITVRDISASKQHEQALVQLANADSLTGLPNRHWMMEFLPRVLGEAKQAGTGVALLYVDLDDFKNINDTLGHPAGDELLKAAAERLISVLRPADHVVRLGGDEFTVILQQVHSEDDICRVAERIVKALTAPFLLNGSESHFVRASIGISVFPEDAADAETLLRFADIAMYAVKGSGKGNYRFYHTRLGESLMLRLSSEQELRRAIANDEFELYYQPRVDTFTGELRSLEALIRWMHPERGMVSPLEFIPLAEETGMITRIGEMVVEKACAQVAQWKAQRLAIVPVSVNVSLRQFTDSDLKSLFSQTIERYELAPSLIEIELTESCMIGEGNGVPEELAAIKQLGIKLLVDDFGTGYSSLSQLQRLDVDVLKIDKSFTAALCNGIEGEVFFMAILSMAHVLGLSVVAEGVETLEQLEILQTFSCNEVQGYLVSRPVPADAVPALFARRFLFPSNVPQVRTGSAR